MLDWPSIIVCGLLGLPYLMYFCGYGKSPRFLKMVLRVNRKIYDTLVSATEYMKERGHEISEALDELEKLDK